MSLWCWQELLNACGLENPSAGPDVSGICIDSRTASAGDLFIALAGDPGPAFFSSSATLRDGHDFIGNAVQNGAVAALVSRDASKTPSKIPVLAVENTLDGLWQLGRFARQRMQGKVTAITGSSGKTTARCWLQQLLEAQDSTHASTGSLNNHWGVPVSLARMPGYANFGVFEIGTNRPGEVLQLVQLVRPDVAILLNVLPAHIGNFGTLEGIRQEKLMIASGLGESGALIVPDDMDLTGCNFENVIRFGRTTSADVCGDVKYHAERSDVRATLFGVSVDYSLRIAGEHRVMTSLAVLAAVHCIGADVGRAATDFEKLTTPDGRGNVLSIAGVTIIDDSYNANPISMAYAIDTLVRQAPAGRRIALLGEMLELGNDSDKRHADIAQQAGILDGVITVGPGFANYPGNWGHVGSAGELDLVHLHGSLRPGDVVLIKGSNKVFWTTDFVSRLSLVLQGQAS